MRCSKVPPKKKRGKEKITIRTPVRMAMRGEGENGASTGTPSPYLYCESRQRREEEGRGEKEGEAADRKIRELKEKGKKEEANTFSGSRIRSEKALTGLGRGEKGKKKGGGERGRVSPPTCCAFWAVGKKGGGEGWKD